MLCIQHLDRLPFSLQMQCAICVSDYIRKWFEWSDHKCCHSDQWWSVNLIGLIKYCWFHLYAIKVGITARCYHTEAEREREIVHNVWSCMGGVQLLSKCDANVIVADRKALTCEWVCILNTEALEVECECYGLDDRWMWNLWMRLFRHQNFILITRVREKAEIV